MSVLIVTLSRPQWARKRWNGWLVIADVIINKYIVKQDFQSISMDAMLRLCLRYLPASQSNVGLDIQSILCLLISAQTRKSSIDHEAWTTCKTSTPTPLQNTFLTQDIKSRHHMTQESPGHTLSNKNKEQKQPWANPNPENNGVKSTRSESSQPIKQQKGTSSNQE
jgi:hypothetical protein